MSAFTSLFEVLRYVPVPRWATPTLIVLGIASSFAETLGISLIVLFVYTAMGQLDAVGSTAGVLGHVLDAASRSFDSSLQLALVLFALILARGALAFVNNVVSSHVSELLSARSRERVHEQYLTIGYGFMQRQSQAQLMEVLGTEVWLVAGAYASFTRTVVSLCAVVVFLAFLIALSWKIALLAGAGSLAVSLLLRHLREPARELGARVKRVHEELYDQMLRTVQGLRTIRAYGLERDQHSRFETGSREARRAAQSQLRLTALLNPLTEVGYLAVLCAILAGGSVWDIGFPQTLAAIALLFRLQPHTREVEGNFLYMAQIEPQLRSVLGFLRTEDKEYAPSGHVAAAPPARSIRFDRVSFQYDDHSDPVLREVSFEIPIGSTTALVGPSGAGKTTIINLLLRLYEPTSGTIWVDDVRLQDLRRSDWLTWIALSGQDIELIEGTVRENIQMANVRASPADVAIAAELAGVSKFVETRAEAYDAWIGQDGSKFSGGQRQRIGLARAILRDPHILLLDEAMNAMDAGLEDRVRSAIDRRFDGRTILIITHRTDTANRAHRIIRLDGGRVIAA